MSEQHQVPAGSKEGKSKLGKAYEFGPLEEKKEEVKSGAPLATVYWVPGTPWTQTSPDIQALGISRYQLTDNGSSSFYRYTLGFTNTKGWGYAFTDQTSDTYDCDTIRNGDHYVSYNSSKPIIVNVGTT